MKDWFLQVMGVGGEYLRLLGNFLKGTSEGGIDKEKTRSTGPQSLSLFIPIPMHHKWFPYQILGGRTLNKVQIDPQTTEIWPKQQMIVSL